MNKKHEMICIACPVGCHLTVYDDLAVEGHKCPRGEEYGIKELTNPTRIVTSTVKIYGAHKSRIPVRTEFDIPKALIYKVMDVLNAVEVEAPIHMGDVIIENILDTGVDVIASRSMKKSN
ncbi:MAG: DUF1667 domain-containing protein [Clostridiales bacterium]|nr:DUF1667 domain-containing protein [Clostridiales bacterium]